MHQSGLTKLVIVLGLLVIVAAALILAFGEPVRLFFSAMVSPLAIVASSITTFSLEYPVIGLIIIGCVVVVAVAFALRYLQSEP